MSLTIEIYVQNVVKVDSSRLICLEEMIPKTHGHRSNKKLKNLNHVYSNRKYPTY